MSLAREALPPSTVAFASGSFSWSLSRFGPGCSFWHSGERFDGSQVQLPSGDVYGDDADSDGFSKADGASGVTADDRLCSSVEFPPVRSEVFRSDEAFNTELPALDKNAEVREPCNDGVELVADSVGEHLQ